jgi:hypothetical protein
MKEIGGHYKMVSAPGAGCKIDFRAPLPRIRSKFLSLRWLKRFRRGSAKKQLETNTTGPVPHTV